MKRLIQVVALVAILAAPAWAIQSIGRGPMYDSDFWRYPNGPGIVWMGDIEDIADGTVGYTGSTLYVVPQSATPSETDEGRVYYDSDTDKIYVYANGSWVDLTAGAGTPAGSDTQMQYNNNGAFGAISTIIWDDTNLEFANDQSAAFGTEADWTLNFDDSVDDQLIFLTAGTACTATTDPMFEIIVGATPTADQQVFGVAKGTQASNTALLTLDEDGDLVIAGSFTASSFTGDVTLSSAETITNTTDTEIAFAQNGGEDIVFDMDAGTNAVGLKSNTGVDELAMGAVDDLTGVGTIAFDAAAASVSTAAGGDAQDLTISVTGATNSSLIATSEGTGADALQVKTTAGGIDIQVAGAAADEDLDLISSTSINLTAAEASDAAIHIETSNAAGQIQITSTDTTADGIEVDSSGGIDIDAADDIDITVTAGGAGEDLLLTQAGAQDAHITLEAAGTSADAVGINASGTGGGISADTDDGAISIVADGAANGDITIDAQDQITIVSTDADGTDSIYIHANGGTSENIKIHADQGTGASALQILADDGTVDVDGAKVTVDSTDDMTITVTTDGADEDLVIQTSGAQDNHVKVISTGTSADALTLHADGTGGGIDVDTDDGAISIVADGAANGDITIDAADKVTIVSTDADGTDSIYLHANGGTSEVIYIHADQGNTATSIHLKSDVGGITLDGGSGGVVFTQGQTRKLMFHPKDVELDGTNPPTLTDYGTDAQTNISALDFDADGGVNGDDICYISWMVPDGYVVDSARLNVAYTFDTAEDGAADEAQFDFAVNAVAAGEALDAAGTDLLNQTTVIGDATADNGKLHITQYNIEVEDIAVDDLVTIEVAVDEGASSIDQGNFLVLYLEIEWESTE